MSIKKFAIITGASRGIGKAIAHKLAKEGMDILISSKNKANLLQAQQDLQEIAQGKVLAISADLGEPKDCENLVEKILAQKRPIDLLVNNAGIFAQGPLLQDTSMEALMQVNLFSVHTLTKGLMPLLRKSAQAHIFNMCSIASLAAYENSGVYTTTKFALLGYTKSLRKELTPEQIRVTAIMPGATLTDSWAGVDIPIERFIKPSDVAKTLWAAYELSPNATLEELVVRPTAGDL